MKQFLKILFEDRSPSGRLFVFLSLMGVGMMLAGLLISGINVAIGPIDTASKGFILGSQVLQHVLMFAFPAVVFLYYYPKTGILAKSQVNWKLILLAVPLMYLSNPLVELSSHVNGLLDLGLLSEKLETAFMEQQKLASAAYENIVSTSGLGVRLLTIVVIAIIPGITEELFFRAGLQRLFIDLVKNPHLGIWVTAALFSAIHMQPYDFLPRLLLGGLLGYVFYWSGSLWLTILAHWVNNTFALLSVWYWEGKLSHAGDGEALPEIWTIVVYTALLGVNVWLIYRASLRQQTTTLNQFEGR